MLHKSLWATQKVLVVLYSVSYRGGVPWDFPPLAHLSPSSFADSTALFSHPNWDQALHLLVLKTMILYETLLNDLYNVHHTFNPRSNSLSERLISLEEQPGCMVSSLLSCSEAQAYWTLQEASLESHQGQPIPMVRMEREREGGGGRGEGGWVVRERAHAHSILCVTTFDEN